MREAFLMEQMVAKVTTGPIDLDAGANVGVRFDMQKFKRVTFFVIAAAGTTPNAHAISFQQHDAASAGNSVALEIDNPWFHQVNAATAFTKVQPVAKVSSFDIDAVVGDTKFVAVFEVLQEDLLANGANRWISLNIADVGGAQLGTVLAIGHNATELPAYSKVV